MVNVRMHQGFVMSLYEGAKTRVIVIIELSEELVANVRMHQGSVMSLYEGAKTRVMVIYELLD